MSRQLFPQSISIVLPAFNEEECIEEAVTRCTDYLPTAFSDWEVIVVDDGSADSTAEIVARLVEKEPRVRLLALGTNQGYGRAIDAGFRAAEKDLIFFTDADCQFDVRELNDAVPMLEDHDVLLGFRVYRYDSVLRCLLSWTYNRLVRVLFGIGVKDVDCSFKLFKREVIEKLTLTSSDFFIDTEIVARLGRMKDVRIIEKGVRHYTRMAGRTTVRASHIPKTLMTVCRMWFEIRR